MLARDLVNEPANVLGPVEFAARAEELKALGVEVEVLTETEMRKLGMARAARRRARVGRGRRVWSIMRWNGAGPRSAEGKGRRRKPVAFVGKGVVFDTGGISIKPAAGMEDMKGDMGGAAAVAGLMHALAARKAKVNAVGVDRPRREHARRRRAAAGRHRHLDVGQDHRGHQHRRRGPPRPRRRGRTTPRTASSRSSWSISRR